MQLQRISNGQAIALGTTLGSGGEGKIYTVSSESSLVAKIYHKPTSEHRHKLSLMLANPPHDPMVGQGQVAIAWPVDLLCVVGSSSQIVGFLMRRVTQMRPIHEFYTPKNRRQHTPFFNYLYLHRTARNLAAAARALHASGYVIGDVNESNILISNTALVTLVDTDSFQVRDRKTAVIYRCGVGKPEFTPPELQGQTFSDITRTPEHDLFGLAVLIFQLLMEGTQPFAGRFQGFGEPPPYEARIASGHFPYGTNRVPYLPPPLAPPLEILHPTLRQLFRRCFESGHHNPLERPDAQTWVSALEEAEKALLTCAVNKQHRYGNHLSSCPWCQRAARLGGRDPFSPQIAVPKPLPKPKPKPQPVKSRQQLPQPTLPQTTQRIKPYVPPRHLYSNTLLASSAILLLGWAGYEYWESLPLETVAYYSPDPVTTSPPNSEPILSQPPVTISSQIPNTTPVNLSPAYTLKGDSTGVLSVAFSPDGQTLASGSWDNTIKLWNLTTGQVIRTLKGHSDWVRAVAVSLDGQMLASGSNDNTIKLWNLATGQQIRTMAGHSYSVSAVAFSSDGQTLASGSGDGTIKLWNVATGEQIRTVSKYSYSVSAVAFSPDGQTLVTGNQDGTIKVWSLATGQELDTLNGYSGFVYSVAFSPDGKTLASGSFEGAIKLWNLATGQEIHTLKAHSDWVLSVAFSSDGQMLASGSVDRTIEIWRVLP